MRQISLWLLLISAAVAPAQAVAPWRPPPGHQVIRLWPHGAPGLPPSPGEETTKINPKPLAGRAVTVIGNVSNPSITVYTPTGKRSNAGVLIFPGGGYRILAIDLEGTEVAQWLNAKGITAFLVTYRVPGSGPYPEHRAALEDAQRAMGIVRARAAEWNLDPEKLGVIGFSAGANLAVALSNRYEKRIYPVTDKADETSCRPDFALILYPAYLTLPERGFILNPEIAVDKDGPPAFLVQAENDPVHVENAIEYFLALKRAAIPAEMHIYAQGGHGFGLRSTNLPITHWTGLAEQWLHTIGILP